MRRAARSGSKTRSATPREFEAEVTDSGARHSPARESCRSARSPAFGTEQSPSFPKKKEASSTPAPAPTPSRSPPLSTSTSTGEPGAKNSPGPRRSPATSHSSFPPARSATPCHASVHQRDFTTRGGARPTAARPTPRSASPRSPSTKRQTRPRDLSVPLFDLTPACGEPARFGFEIVQAPVILDTSVRSGTGEDYGVTVSTANTTQLANFLSSTVTFWARPATPATTNRAAGAASCGGVEGHRRPLECNHRLQTAGLPHPAHRLRRTLHHHGRGDSWPNNPGHRSKFLDPVRILTSKKLRHPQPSPAATRSPSTPRSPPNRLATPPPRPPASNFDIDVEDEGLLNPEGVAQSQIKKAVVTLPQGFTANPSVAEGLRPAATPNTNGDPVEPARLHPRIQGRRSRSRLAPGQAPEPPRRALRRQAGRKPGGTPIRSNLLTLYLVARNPEIGVIVKQALKVIPNPVTGQLTTEVDNVPELPFSHFHLSFRQGQRSPLITPPACGDLHGHGADSTRGPTRARRSNDQLLPDHLRPRRPGLPLRRRPALPPGPRSRHPEQRRRHLLPLLHPHHPQRLRTGDHPLLDQAAPRA